MESGTQMTLEEYMPETFQEQIAGVLDSHVKTSQLQESNLGFKETVQACFSELCILWIHEITNIAKAKRRMSIFRRGEK